jgi:hypothetical protein
VGEWFTSFDDAWSSFLVRDEPLEPFFDRFPDDPSFVAEGWVIVPPPEVNRAALRVEGELEGLAGLTIVPHHFLHVWLWLRGDHDGPDLDQLLELPPFEVSLARLNCFHDAVVAEVESEELDRVDAPDTFLPHLSLAYAREPVDPGPVRETLLPLRDTALGTFVVDELVRVSLPAGRATILQPWTVVERFSLRR